MNNEDKAYENPIEDQRAEALRHYEEASAAIHHWSGFVSAAIKAHDPKKEDACKREALAFSKWLNQSYYWHDQDKDLWMVSERSDIAGITDDELWSLFIHSKIITL